MKNKYDLIIRVCYLIKDGLLSYNGEFVFIKGEIIIFMA